MAQRGRWLFLLGQFVCLLVSIDFIVDTSHGGRLVPLLLAATSAAAMILALVRSSWDWVESRKAEADAVAREQIPDPQPAEFAADYPAEPS